jgi:hypothetical protein
VRFPGATHLLLFAKTEEDIQKAAQIAKDTLQELGLEVAMEKTRIVDFNKDDFDFLGFAFGHWRERKKDGKPYFLAQPKESTWKDFRQKIKAKTKKMLTLNPKAWLEQVNPVQRKGHAMKTRWNNEYFAHIGLIPSFWLYYSKQFGHSINDYIDYMTKKQKKQQTRAVERAKEKDQEFYTPDRVRKMQCAQKLAMD